MAKVTGRDAVKRYIASVPELFMAKVLPGAARAGAAVVADEAKDRCESPEVAADIVIRTKRDGDKIRIKVTVKRGWSYSVGVWLEWGTAPHFISVDDRQRKGRSVRAINAKSKATQTLAINGQPIGATVLHPGARAHPFLRPALDLKEAEAIRAAQHYITTRVKRSGLSGTDDMGDDA